MSDYDVRFVISKLAQVSGSLSDESLLCSIDLNGATWLESGTKATLTTLDCSKKTLGVADWDPVTKGYTAYLYAVIENASAGNINYAFSAPITVTFLQPITPPTTTPGTPPTTTPGCSIGTISKVATLSNNVSNSSCRRNFYFQAQRGDAPTLTNLRYHWSFYTEDDISLVYNKDFYYGVDNIADIYNSIQTYDFDPSLAGKKIYAKVFSTNTCGTSPTVKSDLFTIGIRKIEGPSSLFFQKDVSYNKTGDYRSVSSIDECNKNYLIGSQAA